MGAGEFDHELFFSRLARERGDPYGVLPDEQPGSGRHWAESRWVRGGMDPDVSLAMIKDAVSEAARVWRDLATGPVSGEETELIEELRNTSRLVAERCEDLSVWLAKGGFEPSWLRIKT